VNNLYARAVFFVENTERALRYYLERLGFSEDWSHKEDGTIYVCQVSLFGFEVILNQVHDETVGRAGHGRVYIGLEDDQIEPVLKHLAANGVKAERRDWGQPTLVVRDLDANELFFWDWPDKGLANSELTRITEPVAQNER
jgi:catechol 2,3-dioxygenase-like lactoylglutathione lyase family enzyme